MDTTVYRAYGKINLSLDVTGVREDGYHLVRMVMQTVDVSDVLSFTRDPSGAVGVDIAADSAEPGALLLPAGGDNLICRAIETMRHHFGIREGVRAVLQKNIPMAAGMAGGSVDAAAAFRAMQSLFDLEVSDAQLEALALPLGADIPYCLTGGTRLAEGIGEKLTVLPDMPACGIVLVKPAEGVSTGAVYRALDAEPLIGHPDTEAMMNALFSGDLKGICRCCENVLETVTGGMLPDIGRIEEALRRKVALAACMTGSGPTVFGVFEARAQAKKAASALRGENAFRKCRVIASGPAACAVERISCV